MIEKVISGGQTGADIAGLRAAVTAGIPTGGFMPMGYRTLDGFRPEYEFEYNMIAIDTASYAERTRLNVMQSDCTVRFAYDFSTPGERCTMAAIRGYAKPYMDVWVTTKGYPSIDALNKLVDWLRINDFKIVNIAGNSERRMQGMEDAVYKFLVPVFERVNYGDAGLEYPLDELIQPSGGLV